jgi:hypothetical protein
MLIGYNTDVEHEGVVYHVQTEDNGIDKPFILSLVYVGGEILVSKRASYDDLIEKGFDDAVLMKRLQRQHKLICAAIHAGRISELKELSHRDAGKGAPQTAPLPEPPPPPENVSPASLEASPRQATQIPISAPDETPGALDVQFVETPTLRSGQSEKLRLLVAKGANDQRRPIKKARVIVRVLGSTFRPTKATATTDKDGVAELVIAIPEFKTGRAALLVRAEFELEVAELRRVIEPNK